MLATGKVLGGNPWVGVLLVTALMSGATCWALFDILPLRWAALAALLAVVAVAALPLMLMAAVPGLRFAGFNAVIPLPLPLNVPLKVTPVSVLVRMADDNCVIGMLPVNCDAGSPPSRLLAVVAIIA